MKPEDLMKKALSASYSPNQREAAFDKLYKDYCKEHGNDKGWNEFNILLREKCADNLTKKQMSAFGICEKDRKKAFFELKAGILQKSPFPIEIFYENTYPVIRKVLKKGKILEIGFGDYPVLINLLNSKGYSAFGIEPFPRAFDNKRTFMATMRNLPPVLSQKYDIILANMVYSICYTNFFAKNFKWELKNKKILIRKIASLLKTRGYLILLDDLGTIFPQALLKKYFSIVLFEKDIPATDFVKNKIDGFVRITILRKKA